MSRAPAAHPLWTRDEAVAATGGACDTDWRASGVSIDSRTLQPGELFVALAGPTHDGHDFIAKALAAGAAAVLAHRRPEGLAAEAPLLLVKDTLEGLRRLGAAARARSRATCLAVTGSVGKTSTKEMLRHVLAAQGPAFAAAASFNNHWGVPLTLARLPAEARYAVFEIGMNHAGEIRPLSRLARPHVALVTQIAPAHIEYFPDGLAGIADAKAEIFEGLEPGGHAVINRDAPQAERLVARATALGARVLTFGRHADATVRLLDLSLHATCSAIKARVGRETLDYCLSLPGEHMAMNSLGVLAAVQAAGADLVKAAQAMAGLKGLKGRGQRRTIAVAGGSCELIDDSYNANPVSMAAALAVLGQVRPGPGGRRVAVLGDMLELGAQRDALHAGLATPLLDARVDLLFACGPGMAALFAALPAERRGLHTADSAQLAPRVLASLRPGDVVLVKGSLGSRMARVIETLTQPPPAAVSA